MEAHDFMSPAKEGVKKAKHIMEKRRRARINASLAELKSLLPGGKGRKGLRIKMEKADILERAVEHLRLLQESYYCRDTSTSGPNRGPGKDDILSESYSKGYGECLDDVDDYLVRMRIEDEGMRAQVMRHIAYKKSRFKQARVNRTDFFIQDKKVKRCGTGLGQKEGWSRDSQPRSRLAPTLSPYQHTHSPADSTTPEDHGFDKEMRDDSSDDSAVVVKSELEASGFDEQKESAVLDCPNPAKSITESKLENRGQTTDSYIKLEFLNVRDGDMRKSNHDSVSISVVHDANDKSRSSSKVQPHGASYSSSSNDDSSSSDRDITESLSDNRDDRSSERHRNYNNANNNLLNAGKTPRFIVTANRQKFTSSKTANIDGNKNSTDSCCKNRDVSWTGVSSLPVHNLIEASLPGCSVVGKVEQSRDFLKPSFATRSPKTQLRVDLELRGNSFRVPSTSLDSSQPRKAHSSSVPLSQQLSILIPASGLPASGNQPRSPCRPLTDPSQATAFAGNNVNAQPDRPFPKHHNLLLKASSSVDETASQPHKSSGSLPYTAATNPTSRNAEFSNRLLVAQLIKPLNEFPCPARESSGFNLTGDSHETEEQPCDLSVKTMSRRGGQTGEERREPEERGALCHPNLVNSQPGKTDHTVWRPW